MADVILIGCVSKKRDTYAAAKDLYVSDLFLKRRAYAEATGKPWAILSGLYGFVAPDRIMEPYEFSLRSLRMAEREAWGARVVSGLFGAYGPLRGKVFEVHAGVIYTDALYWPLVRVRHAEMILPMAGLRLGEQLAWYREHT